MAQLNIQILDTGFDTTNLNSITENFEANQDCLVQDSTY